MRVVSLNVNGLRSALNKGLLPWLRRQDADLICLQEIRAEPENLRRAATAPRGYEAHYLPAQKKGYSGVALWSRRTPLAVHRPALWPELLEEGRWLQFDFKDFSIVSVYFPSGSSGEHRQAAKFRFLEHCHQHLSLLRRQGREFLLCGDLNIAHQKIDLENWRGNQDHSGFLPAERAWLDRLYGELGFVDVFRRLRPEPKLYTWWSNRGRAYEKNVGWRIDLQVATPGLAETASRAEIYTRRRFSDHAPVIIDYHWPFR
jgi:exodeoxyribonuclease-3